MGVYGMIISGWASNSKYPFLGGLRAAAQMVSYEVSIGFVIVCVVLYAGRFNLSRSSSPRRHRPRHVQRHRLQPVAVPDGDGVLHLGDGRDHRAPFDLPEAESELVAGYQTEYWSMASRCSGSANMPTCC